MLPQRRAAPLWTRPPEGRQQISGRQNPHSLGFIKAVFFFSLLFYVSLETGQNEGLESVWITD